MKFTKRTLPKNLPLLLKERVSQCPKVYLQAAKDKNSVWQYYTYEEFYESVIAFAQALLSIGVKRGDNIALMSDNRREWFITDYAILCLGSADVPRGCDSMGTEMRFITAYADCKFGFFENERQLCKILEKIEEVPLLKTVILFDKMTAEAEERAKNEGLTFYYFEDLLEKGRAIVKENPFEKKAQIEAEMEKTSPDDVATMIFTSGTTGTPKGVMLTHNNYISQLSVIHDFIGCKEGDWWMTILPVWHVFESIDSGHAQTSLWQMTREIEAMMAEVQKQLENVSSEYEAEECLINMHELQDQIEILNAAIYELQQDA